MCGCDIILSEAPSSEPGPAAATPQTKPVLGSRCVFDMRLANLPLPHPLLSTHRCAVGRWAVRLGSHPQDLAASACSRHRAVKFSMAKGSIEHRQSTRGPGASPCRRMMRSQSTPGLPQRRACGVRPRSIGFTPFWVDPRRQPPCSLSPHIWPSRNRRQEAGRCGQPWCLSLEPACKKCRSALETRACIRHIPKKGPSVTEVVLRRCGL